MDAIKTLRNAEPRTVLNAIAAERTPAIMSYSSSGKMHICKVTLVNLGAAFIEAEISPRIKPQPMNIGIGQKTAISLKHGYGKIMFDTAITNLLPSLDRTSGGRVILAIPQKIEIIERRSYYRVPVPQEMQVSARIWHQKSVDDESPCDMKHFWNARMVDISAGGLQVTADASQKQFFKAGQFIAIEFSPMAGEEPLRFNTQIRNIIPTADEEYLCIGLQTVNLEMSAEGRDKLRKICDVVERYHRMNVCCNKKPNYSETGSFISE